MEIFNTQINKSTKFALRVQNFYKLLSAEHRRLFNIWEDEDAEQIIRNIGPDAKALFDLSTAIQSVLKAANPDYQMIEPYKIIITQEPKLDENNEPLLDEEGNVRVRTLETKVLLTPTFNTDGTLKELIVKS